MFIDSWSQKKNCFHLWILKCLYLSHTKNCNVMETVQSVFLLFETSGCLFKFLRRFNNFYKPRNLFSLHSFILCSTHNIRLLCYSLSLFFCVMFIFLFEKELVATKSKMLLLNRGECVGWTSQTSPSHITRRKCEKDALFFGRCISRDRDAGFVCQDELVTNFIAVHCKWSFCFGWLFKPLQGDQVER